MQTKKILGIALAAALVGSMATVAAVSVSAKDYDNFGIVGSPTNWGNELEDGTKIPDVKMVDPDGDKIFKGVLKDVPAGEVQFKVRTNNDWTDSWGEYEDVEGGRTYNSQTNCQLTLDVMSNIYVQIDTSGDEDWLWPVTYKAYVPQTKASSFGIIGSFPQCNDEEGNVWAKDVEMYDYDGDGIYTGVVRNVEAAEGGYDFKVRADGAWTLSWGVYEYDAANIEVDRTQNSQTNLHVDITDASDVIVTIDTTCIDPDALAEAGSYANSADFVAEDTYLFWPVRYEVVPAGTAADPTAEKPAEDPTEESSEESTEESSEESTEESSTEPGKYSEAYNAAKAQLGEDLSGYYFFDNSETKWATVGVYWWTPAENAPWPGQAAIQIEGTDIWAVQYTPETDTIIFNNLVSDADFTVDNPKLQTQNIVVSSETNAGQIFVIDMATEEVPNRYKGAVKMYDGAWMTFNDDAPVVEPSEESSEEPTEESTSTAPTESSTTPSNNNGSTDVPATGDNTMTIVFVVVGLAALGTVALVSKKKSVKD